LADFLRAARATKAKFLLTSRRDEHNWLHDLPARIELLPMRLADCVQMTKVLAKKRGRRLEDVDDWRPLLRFTQGNPLTLTVLVGQALRDGLKSREQIAEFVKKLEAGEEVFDDEVSEGRTRSLAASLMYGFENAFSEEERKQLALLHLFQGFVQVGALRTMGDPGFDWCLPELRGLTREAGISLLDRAAEVGLLTARGGGGYSIHPALQWFLRRLFDRLYSGARTAATRAYVEAIGAVGDRYFWRYEGGDREVVGLAAEEGNLLRARGLARSNGWWPCVIQAMQGLRHLYWHAARDPEWSRLVEEIVPDFVDPVTEGALPGREEQWRLVTQYRVRLATGARRWEEAERLSRLVVAWNRQRVAPVLAKPPQAWEAEEKNTIRSLASSLHELSQMQRERGLASCVDGYRESFSLAESIQDAQAAATCALNLGRAHEELVGVRALTLAEQWYHRSLDLRARDRTPDLKEFAVPPLGRPT
jgi:hypothetical protein